MKHRTWVEQEALGGPVSSLVVQTSSVCVSGWLPDGGTKRVVI